MTVNSTTVDSTYVAPVAAGGTQPFPTPPGPPASACNQTYFSAPIAQGCGSSGSCSTANCNSTNSLANFVGQGNACYMYTGNNTTGCMQAWSSNLGTVQNDGFYHIAGWLPIMQDSASDVTVVVQYYITSKNYQNTAPMTVNVFPAVTRFNVGSGKLHYIIFTATVYLRKNDTISLPILWTDAAANGNAHVVASQGFIYVDLVKPS